MSVIQHTAGASAATVHCIYSISACTYYMLKHYALVSMVSWPGYVAGINQVHPGSGDPWGCAHFPAGLEPHLCSTQTSL